MHTVFLVSYLKKYNGSDSAALSPTLPEMVQQDAAPVPQAVLDRRRKNQVLIHWEGSCPADASWEDVGQLQGTYPTFMLERTSIFLRVGVI